ncbi:FAD-dependent oxidoreductase [Paracoccus contaminans]|uniref:Thiamine biosynthesis protein thio n=1 Tax=Paracoccus contaminans TaxID=1945662 RepID=A0A1W6D1I1_9RHOB|nr:FAD-dependent oxidoreductase [Paracoccus contaminans]ARJ70889.1 thiamine biosynthesis protein thio [Paracoccus contaminans]
MSRVTILGAGVLGLALATELAARGADVHLVDPHPVPGGHGCSWWAGGMLAPCCEFENAEEPVLRYGRAAIDWWDRHAGGVTRAGTLVVTPARDRRELDRFARRTEGFEVIGADPLAALEPDMAGRFDRALFFPAEAHLDPRAALAALHGGLARRGITVAAAPPAGPGQVIDCRGLAARDILPDLRGVRGEMLVLRCPEVTLSRPVRLLHPRVPIYLVPRGGGLYMLGATMIESDRRGVVTARSVLELLSAAYALHPAFGEAEIVELGADARPAFPDNLPRIGRAGGRLYANGLYRHGYLLAPAVAMQMADHIETGAKPEFWHETDDQR